MKKWRKKKPLPTESSRYLKCLIITNTCWLQFTWNMRLFIFFGMYHSLHFSNSQFTFHMVEVPFMFIVVHVNALHWWNQFTLLLWNCNQQARKHIHQKLATARHSISSFCRMKLKKMKKTKKNSVRRWKCGQKEQKMSLIYLTRRIMNANEHGIKRQKKKSEREKNVNWGRLCGHWLRY